MIMIDHHLAEDRSLPCKIISRLTALVFFTVILVSWGYVIAAGVFTASKHLSCSSKERQGTLGLV